jgi:hypothetical protein
MHHDVHIIHRPPPHLLHHPGRKARKRTQINIFYYTMTAPLPTPNTRDYSTQSLRSYRGAAASYLKSREKKFNSPTSSLELEHPPSSCSSSPACGSPPRFRPSHPSRCRSRTPSPPSSPAAAGEGETSSKTPRTVSPGGTPATSAGTSSRQAAKQEAQLQPGRHRVRWAEDLVVNCYTRPRTLRKDVSALFYSRADELRFRREAETTTIVDKECRDEPSEEDEPEGGSLPSSPDLPHPPLGSTKQERKDYAISKAVVVFGNSTKTYGGCALEATTSPTSLADGATTESTFSFDDAAFWNGLLTWS